MIDVDSNRIVGRVVEFSAFVKVPVGIIPTSVGGEVSLFFGYDQVTGKDVFAVFAGAQGSVDFSVANISAGGGVFGLDGNPSELLGPSVDAELNAGLGTSAGFSPGGTLVTAGLSSQAGVSVTVGATLAVYHVRT